MPYCPKCGKRISEASNFCKACGYELEAEETPVGTEKAESKVVIPEQAEQVTARDASLKKLKCVNHPERDSIGICSNCSKGVCIYCRTVIEGKGYCPSCAENAAKVISVNKDRPAAETSISPSLEKAQLRKTAAIYIICGFITLVLSGVISVYSGEGGLIILWVIFWITGAILWVFGWGYYSCSKGRSSAWGVLGILGLIGILVLVLLSDKPLKPIIEPYKPMF